MRRLDKPIVLVIEENLVYTIEGFDPNGFPILSKPNTYKDILEKAIRYKDMPITPYIKEKNDLDIWIEFEFTGAGIDELVRKILK